MYNVSNVPAVPKKLVPEEKVPVLVPVAKKAPPPQGRICLKPLTQTHELRNFYLFPTILYTWVLHIESMCIHVTFVGM